MISFRHRHKRSIVSLLSAGNNWKYSKPWPCRKHDSSVDQRRQMLANILQEYESNGEENEYPYQHGTENVNRRHHPCTRQPVSIQKLLLKRQQLLSSSGNSDLLFGDQKKKAGDAVNETMTAYLHPQHGRAAKSSSITQLSSKIETLLYERSAASLSCLKRHRVRKDIQCIHSINRKLNNDHKHESAVFHIRNAADSKKSPSSF